MIHYLYIAAGVVFLFGAAIFVHEFGHYWMARRRGLKVEAFAIGFGPKIFSWVRNGIEYSVRWIPAGGFVKLPQMVTSAALEGGNTAEQIPPASPFSKILVAAAGPFMNVVFAFAIATLIYFIGLPVPVNPSIIGYVDPSSPEAKMGIREGDRIIAINGSPIKSWEDVNSATMLALTNVLPVTIRHNAEGTNPGKTDTYLLKAEVNNLLGLKTFNLDSRDHLVIKDVLSGKPAEAAGLKAQDEIVGFAGVPITGSQQLLNLIKERGTQLTPIVVKRGDQRLTLEVAPIGGHIGIEFGPGPDIYEIEHPTPWSQVKAVFVQVYQTISALVHSRQSGVKVSDLSGPVGIISVLAVQWNTDYRLALNFLVLLNINLAVLNMLPVPVLDGGHILMAIIERVRRRPMGVRFVEFTTTAFALLLILFMGYVTIFGDIKRIPLVRSMFNRETQIEHPEKPAPVSIPNGH